MIEVQTPGPVFPVAHRGNLLNAAVRRDITDLNRLFLARALDPQHGADRWFQLPPVVSKRLAAASPDARERAAHSPISLFELALPPAADTSAWRLEAVSDGEPGAADGGQREHRRAFGLVALSVAQRLAEGVPLSSRIAFGLGAACETRLSVLSPSESFWLASWPGLVRPRWQGHTRYWELLATAATDSGTEVLRWAYATGLCLLGHCERAPTGLRPPSRRPSHARHRGVVPGGSDVPC